MESMITLPKVMEWLREVKDPEIPVVSLVDLGVITDVAISDNGVKINMTPTFVGCPAMDYMVNDVKSTLNSKGVENVEVIVSFDKQWSSNNISEKGRSALKEFGLAPPPHYDRIVDIEILEQTPCPYCNSTNTELKTPFGPTLCRAIHYCNNCKQAFEQFKPV
ncbi:MAG: phenylacetate-CoA oxygenase subunit PaaJ [Cyclobacteriaceae bacterium]|nr:phenylacetate-CoA oxygenase subunit PaaJ [Cyclobacteriaceae bacterium]